jgi:asparagine synthase (glutamine-hydrolysing)
MCGFVGIIGRQDPSWLTRMNGLLRYRGPDDSGEYRNAEGTVGLAMNRLSILDVEGGHQPMSNADGSIWIVYNGEIFNSPELRTELEGRGCRFQTTNSDTEVLFTTPARAPTLPSPPS